MMAVGIIGGIAILIAFLFLVNILQWVAWRNAVLLSEGLKRLRKDGES